MTVPAKDKPWQPYSGFSGLGFDDPAAWAAMYRHHGFQTVPAKCHLDPDLGGKPWKSPLVPWRDLHKTGIPQANWDLWYGPGGRFADRPNMGLLTGAASSGILALDLDLYKNIGARQWWTGLLAVHNSNIEPETVEQETGGGGVHKLFRLPEGVSIGNGASSIGIDWKSDGGFIMLPPSLHDKGTAYQWKEGHGPNDIPIAMAPQWLLDALRELAGTHPAAKAPGSTSMPPPPSGEAHAAFGTIIDGRENKATRDVWHAVLELHRQSSICPAETSWREYAWKVYVEVYEPSVSSRIINPSLSKREALDLEVDESGRPKPRGWMMFWDKWQRTMRKWGTPEFVEQALRPNPNASPQPVDLNRIDEAITEAVARAKADPATNNLYKLHDVPAIKAEPDPQWLVSDVIVEEALGFFYGPPGCFKTFITLDLALSLSCGLSNWWGYPIQRNGAVIYVTTEGVRSLKYRIAAWEKHRNVNADPSKFRLMKDQISFMDDSNGIKLMATIQNELDQIGPVAAIFVDTVSRVLPGSDENLQKDMTKFVSRCDALRLTFGATVIGVHHTARAGNMRGSTVIPAAGDFNIEVRRNEGQEQTGSIFAEKIKEAEDQWTRNFTVTKIDLNTIVPRRSLVVDGVEGETQSIVDDPAKRGWPPSPILLEIMHKLHDQWQAGHPWRYGNGAENSAVKAIVSRWGLKQKIAQSIIDNWVANNMIRTEIYDAKRKLAGLKKLTVD